MSVRAATPDDALALACIEVTTWQIAYCDLLPDSYLQALSTTGKAEEWRVNLLKHGRRGQKRVLVALDEQAIIGFVRVGTVHEPEPIGLLYLLYVLPSYWRQGIGSALMQTALRELLELGHTTAFLWVLRDNLRARQFYERGSWRQDGRTTTVEYGGSSLQAICYTRTVFPLENGMPT